MAPETATRGARKPPRQNQFPFDLGVKGRKTGLTIPDTGMRDENGFEPMDHLFSSPAKSVMRENTSNGVHTNGDETISSDDMDVGESTVPEPTAVLNERQSMRMPPPRSKSPIKTMLQSPARRHPSLGPVSSPIRGSIVVQKTASVAAPVRRKLDFSTEAVESTALDEAITSRSPQKRASASSSKVASKLAIGTKRPILQPSPLDYEGDESGQIVDHSALDEEDEGAVVDDNTALETGDSFQLVNDDYEDEQIEERMSEAEPQPVKKGRGRPKAKGKETAKEPTPEPEVEIEQDVELEEEATPEPKSTKQGKGRGKTRKEPPVEEDGEERPTKRTRRSMESAQPAPKPAAKEQSSKTKTAKAAPKSKKPITKPAKLASIVEVESPEIQRGPPLPRNSRGLYIMRRETPFEGTGFKQSRYGRNSIKPVAFWKNERIEYSEDEAEDGHGKFLVSRIKEVVRNDEVEARPKKTYHKPSKKGKKPATIVEDEDEDEADPWESNPGYIYNEIRPCDSLDETGVEVEQEELQVAWSSSALVTKDVPGASFKLVKCVYLNFFGAGIIDIPVGGMKKPKNSRKMQMVFFVNTGRVQVTINGGDPFRISHGGMWQVPRANFYSIYNDGTKPARIFYSQGSEVEAAQVEEEEERLNGEGFT